MSEIDRCNAKIEQCRKNRHRHFRRDSWGYPQAVQPRRDRKWRNIGSKWHVLRNKLMGLGPSVVLEHPSNPTT